MYVRLGTELQEEKRPSLQRSPSAFVRSVLPYVWIVPASTLLFALIGLVYVSLRPPRYAAEARLIIENIHLDTTRQDLLPTLAFVDPLIVDSQVEILRSPSLARRTAESLIAAGAPGLPSSIRSGDAAPRQLDTLQRTLEADIGAKRLGQSTVVSIGYTAANADFAATVVNTLVRHYLDEQAASAASYSGSVSAWLRDRVKEVGLKARVVSWASPSTRETGLRAPILFTAFTVLGALLGIMAALAAAALDTRLRDPETAAAAIGGEYFGALPTFSRRFSWRRLLPFRGSRRPRRALPPRLAVERPASRMAHMLRHMRVAILRRRPAPRVVGLTAATSGEGTTTIATNLAHSAAAGGHRVLLVDANMYKPDLTHTFGRAREPGLIELLRGHATPEEAVMRGDDLSPDVLGRGTSVDAEDDAVDLCAGLPIVLASLVEDYDLIVVDLPPMYPVADQMGAALYADAIIVVVQWGAVSPSRIRDGLIASGLADKVVGFLFNKVSEREYRAQFPQRYLRQRRPLRALYDDDRRTIAG